MSDQSPRLTPFFLSIPISLPPLLLHSLLSFYHSHSLFLPFHSPRLALFCFCFLFPSLLPFILAFSSSFPSSLLPVSPSLLLFFFSSPLHFSLFSLFFNPPLFYYPYPFPCRFRFRPPSPVRLSFPPLFSLFSFPSIYSVPLFPYSWHLLPYPCSPFIHSLFIFTSSLVTFHLYLRSLHLFAVLPNYSHLPARPCRYWIILSLLSQTYPPHNSRLLVLLSQIIYTPVP